MLEPCVVNHEVVVVDFALDHCQQILKYSPFSLTGFADYFLNGWWVNSVGEDSVLTVLQETKHCFFFLTLFSEKKPLLMLELNFQNFWKTLADIMSLIASLGTFKCWLQILYTKYSFPDFHTLSLKRNISENFEKWVKWHYVTGVLLVRHSQRWMKEKYNLVEGVSFYVCIHL